MILMPSAVRVGATTLISDKTSDVRVAISVEEAHASSSIRNQKLLLKRKINYYNIETSLEDLRTNTLGCHRALYAAIKPLIRKNKTSRVTILIGIKSPQQWLKKPIEDYFSLPFNLHYDAEKNIVAYYNNSCCIALLRFRHLKQLLSPQNQPYARIDKKIYLEDLYADTVAVQNYVDTYFLKNIARDFPYPDEFTIYFKPYNQMLARLYTQAAKRAWASNLAQPNKKVALGFKGSFCYRHSVDTLKEALKKKCGKIWGLAPESKYLCVYVKSNQGRGVDISQAKGRLVDVFKKHKVDAKKIVIFYQLLYYPDLLLTV
ncbi:MAG: hypothetical protein ACPGC9_01735 [Cytophagales bacterium]